MRGAQNGLRFRHYTALHNKSQKPGEYRTSIARNIRHEAYRTTLPMRKIVCREPDYYGYICALHNNKIIVKSSREGLRLSHFLTR
jgi:hypothetical protein